MRKVLLTLALLAMSAQNAPAITFHDLASGSTSMDGEVPVWQDGGAKKLPFTSFFSSLPSVSSASAFRAAISAVSGPTSSTNGNVATFSGAAGKTIQDSGKALPSGAVVGVSDTQTLTNKTISGASNTISGPISGTATNDNAASGKVGEFIAATPGSNVSLTTAQAKNCTSIPLTAGDWELDGRTEIFGGGTTSQTLAETSLSSTSNTMNTALDHLTADSGPARLGSDIIYILPRVRWSLSASTTIFLVALANFTGGTTSASCALSARRVR
jgi:hypothetical protein